ncbi:MAG: hypothetical protein FJY35_08920 [Betaproteobacteria bacterium]|nr:hypothetical protein [Betaproteobacteria bacterium]
MAEVICVCNGVWEEDLREYLQRYPVSSIDALRAKERICNKCRQCEPLVAALIAEVLSDANAPSNRGAHDA